MGLTSALEYPRCTHAGCTQPAELVDVPIGHPDRIEIEAIHPEVTAGCGGGNYCPDNPVTRGQMAVFLLSAKEGPGYAPPTCVTPMFADVPCSSPFAPWINEMARRGITGGCGGGNYCPENPVTNAQIAVFLIATLGLSPSPCTVAPFADVPCTYWSAAFIAEEARRQITFGCGGGNFCPDAVVTRAKMAGLLVRAFDIPMAPDPSTARTVQYAYTSGLLTSVSAGGTTYGTLSYHPNLLVAQVAHGNGVTEAQGNDPHDIRRPLSLGAAGPYASWSSGNYAYDGAGNIKTIGAAWFAYDKVSRLVSATLYDGPTGGGNQKQQSYTFDPFGNLTNIAGTPGRAIPTSAQTNRLNGPGSTYDAAGNLKSWNGAVYEYDRFNQMTRMTSGGEDWVYVYTADDERLWSYHPARNLSRWTVRDLGGKVLRECQNKAGVWSVGTDYLYRDGSLLAAETPTGRRHFHLDHLGTPRLITRGSGHQAAYHVYYPFGEELTAFNQDAERMKFTGHERDLNSPAGAGDDLDYMHARHCSPVTGRFLSVDPAYSVSLARPQTWNAYSYVRGNPLLFNDPDGRKERKGWDAGTVENRSSQTIYIAASRDGKTTLVISLKPGEKSSDFFEDTDAIVLKKGQSVDGEELSKKSGAYKLGPSDVTVEDNPEQEGDLTINRDGEYPLFFLAGKTGLVSQAEAANEGWILPKDQKELEKNRSQAKGEKEKQKRRVAAERKKDRPSGKN